MDTGISKPDESTAATSVGGTIPEGQPTENSVATTRRHRLPDLGTCSFARQASLGSNVHFLNAPVKSSTTDPELVKSLTCKEEGHKNRAWQAWIVPRSLWGTVDGFCHKSDEDTKGRSLESYTAEEIQKDDDSFGKLGSRHSAGAGSSGQAPSSQSTSEQRAT